MVSFQSTLPARGATVIATAFALAPTISIHAPRTGSDQGFKFRGIDDVIFQSTLPARGATVGQDGACRLREDFNPRSPHGERPAVGQSSRRACDFNPRSPHGERPQPRWFAICNLIISIHAPRTGSDISKESARKFMRISIHAPRTGSDQGFKFRGIDDVIFQSTLPARGATNFCFSTD